MASRLIVIGGDAAGMTAASTAKRAAGDELEVIVFEQGHHTSYSACGIPYWIGGDVESGDDLVARTPEQHRANGIDVRMQHQVSAIDPAGRSVTVAGPDGTDTHPYDRLLVATGATPVRPDLPGIDSPGVFGVQTLDDGERVIEAMEHDPRHAVVVGGGYIGVEMAEACVRRGMSVTVVDAAPAPMGTLDVELGQLIATAMEGLGIRVVCGAAVKEIATDQDGNAIQVRTDQGDFDADIVVLGTGVRPNTGLAKAAGLPLGEQGGLLTDDQMRVEGHDDIWAAGDCVESYDRLTGGRIHIALGTHANKQGLVAGTTIAGGQRHFPGVVRTAVTKVCDLEVARTGLTEADALAAGRDVVAATIESTNRAGYVPGASPITVKMVAERVSGRILGVQIVGREGSAKRIDTCAVALWNEMTADELMMTDLSYAPPLSPLWDPVQVAARAVVRLLA